VTHKVLFTPSARGQFLAALAYIRADNPSAALALRERAGESLARLRQFPESGRIVPEFPDLPFREVVVSPYRFFYRVKGDTAWVVAVWHGAQLPGEPDEVVRG
jgi:toxin ParE1/3/4